MQSYQRRSENRNMLRTSQSTLSLQTSQCSRNSSKRKFLEVCSKKSTEPSGINTSNPNLRSSTISLPVDFEETRSMYPQGFNRSQARLHPPPNPYVMGSHEQVRGHSLPTKTIIIREIIQQVPVNFSLLQPQSVRINPEVNYRQSLPLKQMPQKHEIIRIDQLKQAAAPIRIFSQAPVNHYQAREPIQMQSRVQQNIVSRPITIHQGQTSNKAYMPWQGRIQTAQGSHKESRQMLSNKSYIECEVKLENVEIATEPSNMLSKRTQTQDRPGKQNYSSLVVSQGDEQGNFKQNLQIKGRECICEKIRNFTECSEIKIKQVLKPKKNFIFI